MTNGALHAAPEPEDDFSDLVAEIESGSSHASTLGPWEPIKDGPGAQIAGRVLAVTSIDTQYGSRPVLTIDTPQGEREVRAFHTVLRSQLAENPPSRNARIVIRYEGTATSANGNTYHKYAVAVEPKLRVASGQDWIDVFNEVPPKPRPRGRGTSPSQISDDLPF